MNVRPLNSITAKLFYYMSGLVIVTVAGTSFQYVRSFKAHQSDQFEDTLLIQAEQASSQIVNAIETWQSQTQMAIAPLLNSGENPSSAFSEGIRSFVDANPDFVGMQVFHIGDANQPTITQLGEALAKNLSDNRFDDKVPTRVWNKIQTISRRWLQQELANPKTPSLRIDSIAKLVDLPIMLLAIRSAPVERGGAYWSILAVWQSRIIDALPRSRWMSSSIIDGRGNIFAATNVSDMLYNRKYQGESLVQSALNASESRGFLPSFVGEKSRNYLGAYARLPRIYGLVVLVDAEADVAYRVLDHALTKTLLWAALFILIGAGLAYLIATEIIKRLHAINSAMMRIAAGDLQPQIVPSSHDEIGVLGLAVNQMAVRLAQAMHNQKDKVRLEKDKEISKAAQTIFTAKRDAKVGALSVAGFHQPAAICGGDLWGYIPINDDLHFIYIGDAMNRGAPAALMASATFAAATALAEVAREVEGFKEGPSQFLTRLNRLLYKTTHGAVHMTFFAAILDMKKGLITYANAGHNFPVLVPVQANDPRCRERNKGHHRQSSQIAPLSLVLAGTPLGVEKSPCYQEKSLRIRAGDKIFFFTDGLIECSSPQGSVWGRKHLVEQVVETATLDAINMKDELLARAFSFFSTKPLEDDVTAIVVEVDKTWEASDLPVESDLKAIQPPPPPLPPPPPPAFVGFAQDSQPANALELPQPALEGLVGFDNAVNDELSNALPESLELVPIASVHAEGPPGPSSADDQSSLPSQGVRDIRDHWTTDDPFKSLQVMEAPPLPTAYEGKQINDSNVPTKCISANEDPPATTTDVGDLSRQETNRESAKKPAPKASISVHKGRYKIKLPRAG